nr:MAG TPA: hypothetical protein [Bacteriophage sp.]
MFNCAICYFIKYYSIYIDLHNYSIYNVTTGEKKRQRENGSKQLFQ